MWLMATSLGRAVASCQSLVSGNVAQHLPSFRITRVSSLCLARNQAALHSPTVRFSLWSPTTEAQLHSVRWANTCVLLTKKVFHHVSFLVLALTEHPLPCACSSETFPSLSYSFICVSFNETFLKVSALTKHPFTCIHFRKTLLHIFAPTKRNAFQRILKFPLQCSLLLPGLETVSLPRPLARWTLLSRKSKQWSLKLSDIRPIIVQIGKHLTARGVEKCCSCFKWAHCPRFIFQQLQCWEPANW